MLTGDKKVPSDLTKIFSLSKVHPAGQEKWGEKEQYCTINHDIEPFVNSS
jgi:hypothetical protein